ncbi:hypothetical protein DY000_02061584 [Brassica cretica]|uniref:Uncharacterized protein n=1 Tax=Brassica cretica TaxID=69181 RepID=A0ABQ7AMY7_BRACR|nr:hypothetical protein DY000_02061584 [Brassica cretica]
MTVPRNVSSELPRIGPSENPSVYSEEISDELGVLGIPSEISEEIPRKKEFPKTYFVGMSSEYRYSDDIPTIFSLSMSLFSCSAFVLYIKF